MYNLMYCVWNHPMSGLPISLKSIKMRCWTYQRSTPYEKNPEKVYFDIPPETQYQHSLSRINFRNLINLSTHNLLSKIFRHTSWQNLHKQVPNLFNCNNFQKLDTALSNIPMKPNILGCILLTTPSELGWTSSIQYQSTCIVLMERKNHCCINHRHTNCLTKWSCNVDNGKQFPATVSHWYYFCFQSWERSLGL